MLKRCSRVQHCRCWLKTKGHQFLKCSRSILNPQLALRNCWKWCKFPWNGERSWCRLSRTAGWNQRVAGVNHTFVTCSSAQVDPFAKKTRGCQRDLVEGKERSQCHGGVFLHGLSAYSCRNERFAHCSCGCDQRQGMVQERWRLSSFLLEALWRKVGHERFRSIETHGACARIDSLPFLGLFTVTRVYVEEHGFPKVGVCKGQPFSSSGKVLTFNEWVNAGKDPIVELPLTMLDTTTVEDDWLGICCFCAGWVVKDSNLRCFAGSNSPQRKQ